jgi:hypothetical protein
VKISFQTDSKKTEVLKGKSERIGQQEMYTTQKVERNCSGRWTKIPIRDLDRFKGKDSVEHQKHMCKYDILFTLILKFFKRQIKVKSNNNSV